VVGFTLYSTPQKDRTAFPGCYRSIDGSLETDEKQRWEESEKRREEKKKEDQKKKVSEERRCRCAKR